MRERWYTYEKVKEILQAEEKSGKLKSGTYPADSGIWELMQQMKQKRKEIRQAHKEEREELRLELKHLQAEYIEKTEKEQEKIAEEIVSRKYEPQIKLLAGFEADFFIDNTPGKSIGSTIPLKSNFEFTPDFLIGSVHFVCNQKGFYTVDYDPESVKAGLIKLYGDKNGSVDYKDAVCEYLEAERKMLELGKFEILGHADLIKKNNPVLHFFDENEGWYKEQLKLTAKAAARAGVVAEINTGAIARGLLDDVYPSAQFLEYFKDEGVPICINSDAHFADKIDCAWDRATLAAKKAGYKELTYPVSGELIHIPI